MAGQQLTAYLDLVNRTGSGVFSSKEDIVNDAVKNTYGISPFLRGKGINELFKGGKNITDEWFPDEGSTATTHLPGATFSWSSPNTSKYWTAPWRFVMDHMSFIDQEDDLNGPEQMTGMGRFQQVKSMMYGKKQRLMTSVMNKMDNLFFAEPDADLMEVTSSGSLATEPYSLGVFVNEYTSGQFNGAGSAGTAWTTVEGINPTSSGNSKWKNAYATYDSSALTATAATGTAITGINNSGDVIAGFDDMITRVNFVPPTSFQEYFERPEVDRMFISTSRKGYNHFMASTRARQSTWVWTGGGNNPNIGGLNYMGIPIHYWQGLDAATLYPNNRTLGSADNNVAEGNSGSANANMGLGPRYYFLHPKYMLPVFHEKWYIRFRPQITPSDQPEATIVPVSTWYNFVCRSRQRQGILSPLLNAFSAYTN